MDFVGLVLCIRFYGDLMSSETIKCAYLRLLAEGLIFLSCCNQIWILWADFLKVRNIKFHRNPFSGSRADT